LVKFGRVQEAKLPEDLVVTEVALKGEHATHIVSCEEGFAAALAAIDYLEAVQRVHVGALGETNWFHLGLVCKRTT
jgi:hypothetical protein